MAAVNYFDSNRTIMEKKSNRGGLGHPVFFAVPLIDPTEILQ